MASAAWHPAWQKFLTSCVICPSCSNAPFPQCNTTQLGSAMLPSWMEVPEMTFPSHYPVLVWGAGISGSSSGAQLSPTPQPRLHQVPAEKLQAHCLHGASPAFTVTFFACLRFLGLLSLCLKAHRSVPGRHLEGDRHPVQGTDRCGEAAR